MQMRMPLRTSNVSSRRSHTIIRKGEAQTLKRAVFVFLSLWGFARVELFLFLPSLAARFLLLSVGCVNLSGALVRSLIIVLFDPASHHTKK